jgi:hypothetical protein
VLGRSDYPWRHEPILYGWRSCRLHRRFGGRARSTVIEHPRPKRSELYPTMKPVDLVADALLSARSRATSWSTSSAARARR